MDKKTKPRLADFVLAVESNLDFMEQQLDILMVPADIRDSFRYSIKRVRGRCKGMERHAAKLDMMLDLDSELPDAMYVDPPSLSRDTNLFQHQFGEQIRELRTLIHGLQEKSEQMGASNELRDLSILLYETLGNLYYLFVRSRHLIASSIADLSGMVVG